MAIYDINGDAITDTTLTEENSPADAKAVGDALRDIQAQLGNGDGDERRY